MEKQRNYADNLHLSKYTDEGIAILIRRYFNEDFTRYTKVEEVAKGLTAFLSYDEKYPDEGFPHSFLWLINHSGKVNGAEIFKQYKDHCIKFIKEEEKRKPFERRSEPEIIELHLERERIFLEESKLFFEKSDEAISTAVKEAVSRYFNWVEEFYFTILYPGKKIETLTILQDMFPEAKESDLTKLDANLRGAEHYVSLEFTGMKETLLKKLTYLLTLGMSRRTVAEVFAKSVKWKNSIGSKAKTLVEENIYNNIKGKQGKR